MAVSTLSSAAGSNSVSVTDGPVSSPSPGPSPSTAAVTAAVSGAVLAQGGQQLGVGLEEPVEHAAVLRSERVGGELRVEVVAPAPAWPVAVGDVAGRLLQVGRQPAPLERLGEQVGRLLAGEVGAAELGHGVVAVLVEDAPVQLGGPAGAGGRAGRGRAGLGLVGELVQEQAAQALAGARVAREQRALDRLRQVAQREDRPVEVGDVRLEARALLRAELLHPVRRLARRPVHESPSRGSSPTVRPGLVGTRRTASSTPGMNEERSSESCLMVSSSPWPPKTTSWWATRPGRRTEWTRTPSTSPPRTPATDSSPLPSRSPAPWAAAIALAVRMAVPDGASALPAWCSSITSAAA